MFDQDGYPTEETLRQLKEWPAEDSLGALEFMRSAWHWPDFVTEELYPEERAIIHAEDGDLFLRFATGGWSGNEDLIEALVSNWFVWLVTWKLTASAGLFIFQRRSCIDGDRMTAEAMNRA